MQQQQNQHGAWLLSSCAQKGERKLLGALFTSMKINSHQSIPAVGACTTNCHQNLAVMLILMLI
jgi:hypothetical protein